MGCMAKAVCYAQDTSPSDSMTGRKRMREGNVQDWGELLGKGGEGLLAALEALDMALLMGGPKARERVSSMVREVERLRDSAVGEARCADRTQVRYPMTNLLTRLPQNNVLFVDMVLHFIS